MGVPSYLAMLLETGAATNKDGIADPRLIRYITQNYPDNCGVELVIADLEELRLECKLAEPRLAVFLEEFCITLDCGLASKASEGGKMIHNLQRENQILGPKGTTNKDDQGFDSMNYSEQKQDLGNHKYR